MTSYGFCTQCKLPEITNRIFSFNKYIILVFIRESMSINGDDKCDKAIAI